MSRAIAARDSWSQHIIRSLIYSRVAGHVVVRLSDSTPVVRALRTRRTMHHRRT